MEEQNRIRELAERIRNKQPITNEDAAFLGDLASSVSFIEHEVWYLIKASAQENLNKEHLDYYGNKVEKAKKKLHDVVWKEEKILN